MLCVLDTKISSAEKNMALDAELLAELSDRPILHLYDWEQPSVTYGHFISPEKHIDMKAAKKYGVSLAKRPTGGGMTFHIWDYAFSFLMPARHPLFSSIPLENYRFVNEIVLHVMQSLFSLSDSIALIPQSFEERGVDCQNFCMARPTQYDVVYGGTKIAGAAQRKTKKGYLHQGTISLGLPQEDFLSEVLLDKKDVLSAMLSYTFAPLGAILEKKILDEARSAIGAGLAQAFMRVLK